MEAFAEAISLLYPYLYAQANRRILAAVNFWPSMKKQRPTRRQAKRASVVKRLKRGST